MVESNHNRDGEKGQISMLLIFIIIILYAVYFCGQVALENYQKNEADAKAAAVAAANPYHIPYAY